MSEARSEIRKRLQAFEIRSPLFQELAWPMHPVGAELAA